MTFVYDIYYIWHVVLYIFHDCFQNNREKCIVSPNPLFYRCNFFHYEKQYAFSTNSNETRRNCTALAAPDFANSGKNMRIFLVVVVAVVVIVVVAVDIVEDDAEDLSLIHI